MRYVFTGAKEASHGATSGAFPSTRWSLVCRAAESGKNEAALESLLRQYLRPMKRYVTARWRIDAAAADDLLQDFVAEKILRQEILATAQANRGRFRSFLLTVLNRFSSNYFRDQRRLKRGGGVIKSLGDGELAVAAPESDPAQRFNHEWATLVLERAIDRMRHECISADRHDLWGVFEARVLGPTLYQRPAEAYGRLVERFSFASPQQASNALISGKRMFARCLRQIVTEYAEPDEADAEIAELQAILASGAPSARDA
jgi:RNA polymerase sigma-70 factor (ECF subfamily)